MHAAPSPAKPSRSRPKARPLKGTAAVPGDKSISQRALILGAHGRGRNRAFPACWSRGCAQHRRGGARLWARTVARDGDGLLAGEGRGVGGWREPDAALDFGNSGTGSRLMMGAVATTPITAIFTGDASCARGPWRGCSIRLTPVRRALRGAGREGADAADADRRRRAKAPSITRDGGLGPGEVRAAAGGAERARAISRIIQNALTRDHTEKMLAGVRREDLRRDADRWRRGRSHVTGEVELKACADRRAARSVLGGVSAGRGADRAGLRDHASRHPAQSPPHRPDRNLAGDGRRYRSREPRASAAARRSAI